jgi:hypothetical protein
MQPEDNSLYIFFKKPTTSFYPQPYESSPNNQSYNFKIHFNIIFKVILFPSDFSTKTLYASLASNACQVPSVIQSYVT